MQTQVTTKSSLGDDSIPMPSFMKAVAEVDQQDEQSSLFEDMDFMIPSLATPSMVKAESDPV